TIGAYGPVLRKNGWETEAFPVKRVLLSGAAGFIGSHLCDRLLQEAYEVVGVDNFITGHERNISRLAGAPYFEFRRHDVTTPLAIAGRFDYVIHAASPASPRDYLE